MHKLGKVELGRARRDGGEERPPGAGAARCAEERVAAHRGRVECVARDRAVAERRGGEKHRHRRGRGATATTVDLRRRDRVLEQHPCSEFARRSAHLRGPGGTGRVGKEQEQVSCFVSSPSSSGGL